MRKSAKIILFKGKQVLLQLRENKQGIPYPNTWTLLGGRLEDGETPEEAIRREIKEELEIELKDIEFVTKHLQSIPPQDSYPGEANVEYNIFAAPLEKEVSEINLQEGQAIRLFSVEEMDSIKIVPYFKKIVKDFLAKIR